MEELASNGFIVVSVSHPKDDFATVYSDGTVLPYDLKLKNALNNDMLQAINYTKSKYSTDDVTPEMQRAMIMAAKKWNENVRLWCIFRWGCIQNPLQLFHSKQKSPKVIILRLLRIFNRLLASTAAKFFSILFLYY